MSCWVLLKARFSLAFIFAVQLVHAIHGYTWWFFFSALGPLFLCVPVTSTYGGAVMVILDDARGYCYTSELARVMTAAFMGFMLTLIALACFGMLAIGLGLLGIFV